MNFATDGEVYDGESTTTYQDASQTCSVTPPVNVKDSLILSIVMMCIPGILEKTMEWKEIKCETAVCSYEAVKNNLDPAFCKKQASYKTCKYIMGEVFAMPPLAILEYLRDLIASVLANPAGYIYSFFVMEARIVTGETCAIGSACDPTINMPLSVAVPLVVFNDALATYQTFVDMMENGFSSMFGMGGESKCEQLSEIREDIEGLVENG